jgi:hypothetical protein
MKLNSKTFNNGGKLPKKYSCQGPGTSPQLSWSDLPESTEALALRCFDPDAPGDGFVHWLVYNIKPEIDGFPEGEKISGIEVVNDGGQKSYYPACPPDGEHRYEFTLYALGKEIENVTPKNFLDKVNEASIAQDKITALYSKE